MLLCMHTLRCVGAGEVQHWWAAGEEQESLVLLLTDWRDLPVESSTLCRCG